MGYNVVESKKWDPEETLRGDSATEYQSDGGGTSDARDDLARVDA